MIKRSRYDCYTETIDWLKTGYNIKIIQNRRNLTNDEIEKVTGIKVETLQAIKNGTPTTIYALYNISRVLNVSLDCIISGSQDIIFHQTHDELNPFYIDYPTENGTVETLKKTLILL